MNETFLNIAVIAYGILIFATGFILVAKKLKPQNETFLKVGTIIKTWWLIVTFLMITIGLEKWGLCIGFAVLSALVAREYFRHSGNEYKKILFGVHLIFIALQYYALAAGKFSLYQALPMLTIMVTLPLLVVIKSSYERMPQLVAALVGPIVLFHLLGALPALYLEAEKNWGGTSVAMLTVFLLILLTEANDVIQFICGKLWGKRKIIPALSPNKTEAGFIGGLVIITVAGSLLFHSVLGLSLFEGALLGFLISFFGILGDLYFSAVKRFFGTKDFSDALPGHGGYLDRLDSLVLTSPVIFYSLLFLKGGF
jgi:phosphatidate cytidylyltransferase